MAKDTTGMQSDWVQENNVRNPLGLRLEYYVGLWSDFLSHSVSQSVYLSIDQWILDQPAPTATCIACFGKAEVASFRGYTVGPVDVSCRILLFSELGMLWEFARWAYRFPTMLV